MATSSTRLPRMMIGFVVRRCAVDLGHRPSAAEFAAWANSRRDDGEETYCLFGRPINESEAAVILKHQARLVSAQSAAPEEVYVEAEDQPGATGTVVDLAAVRARLTRQRANGRRRN